MAITRPFYGHIEELEWRGLVSDCTDREALTSPGPKGGRDLYCGFDPTADSLTLGTWSVAGARRFQQFGHKPIILPVGNRLDR
ncbi:MAG: hypothetical protein CM1200mP29_09470 [Verrucomicrobiota bacterium]|nr:MAG: hypothetical protein CM1200mP29_09470 [Verrucomicrobiota bacterium]